MSKTWPSFHKWGPFSLSSISNRIIDLVNLTNKKSDSNKTVFIVIGNGYDMMGPAVMVNISIMQVSLSNH